MDWIDNLSNYMDIWILYGYIYIYIYMYMGNLVYNIYIQGHDALSYDICL